MEYKKRYPHYVMDFNHREGEQKFYQPTWLTVMQSWKKARQEVATCAVVCSNCHRERTFQRRSSNQVEDGRGCYQVGVAGEVGSAWWARTTDKLINSRVDG